MTPLAPWARAPPSTRDRLQAIDVLRAAVQEFQSYLASALHYFPRLSIPHLDVGRLDAIARSLTKRADRLQAIYSQQVFRRAITDRRYLRPLGTLLMNIVEESTGLAFVLSRRRQPEGARLQLLLDRLARSLAEARQRVAVSG